jgi:hypothetical protein
MQPQWRAIWVSLVVFVAACMLNRLDISIRHFSIALALIVLLLAPLPRALELLREANPQTARLASWLTVALALVSVVTAIRAYPNYLPYLNSLSLGRPGYHLVNDSNLDWNHALPQVETFVHQRGLSRILLDQYGWSEPGRYIPEAQLWDCQRPGVSDGGQWAAVSANYIEESANCIWLLQYPHEALADGSMYAVQLPQVIPPPGSPGGPPLPTDYRYLAGMQLGDLDVRSVFLNCIRDPQQLQPTMDQMMAIMAESRKKK